MRRKYALNNSKKFSEVCENRFGRKTIYTNVDKIDSSNIVKELQRALATHTQNALEIDYLYQYYKGNQPILYKTKQVRPEINEKVVENIAYFIVETKVADIAGEPIQYVLRGTDEKKSQQIADLNSIMDSEDKAYNDIALARWRAICGTAYRYIGNDSGQGSILDETEFYIDNLDPRDTFVVYYSSGLPAFSCQISEDEKKRTIYLCYTNEQWFKIRGNEIVDTKENGFFAIPVIEYPNNENCLSDIEVTIGITDSINEMASDRADGLKQFVQSFLKFINCEMDEEKFKLLRQMGAFIVKSNNGDNKADVDIMSSELNQTESQVAVDDLFEKLLVIQGLANRQSKSGGDTAGAVELRNGHYDSEKRAELTEPIFKKSEKKFLKIVLYYLNTSKGYDLKISDVEVKISRTKMDNMLTKAETLKLLLDCGIYPARAIKTVGYFADPEQVAIESAERMAYLYPTEDKVEDGRTE